MMGKVSRSAAVYPKAVPGRRIRNRHSVSFVSSYVIRAEGTLAREGSRG